MSNALRDFQQELKDRIYAAWSRGARNVMAVAPTGAGKTVLFGRIVSEMNLPSVLIAHRQELVGQAALALNREGVAHGVIAPRSIQHQIVTLEQETHGRSFYSSRAIVRVAGVDTLIRHNVKDPWLKQVGLVIQDEGHHVLRENKWGKAQELFPAARGLFVTAHALRADGKGLGRAAEGLVDELIVGPSARELIERGFLCDYRLVAPPSDVHRENLEVSASTGDYKQDQVRAAIKKSKTIVGDVAKHYLRFAAGKLGITFAVSIESATEIAASYRAAGVPAEVISGDTPMSVRGALMRQFRARQILQLVSVDVLGEGVDVPAVEVISMARPTASFQLYSQQFGRALRLMLTDAQSSAWNTLTDAERLAAIAAGAKPHAIIIDHVENYVQHGLPDVAREYSLSRADRAARAKTDVISLRYCLNELCYQAYASYLSKCPACGTPRPPPRERSSVDQVEGNCLELDPVVLEQMRREQSRIDGPARIPNNVPGPTAASIRAYHILRQEAQRNLRSAMALWAGWQNTLGRDAAEIQRLFFRRFGRDVLGAQVLGVGEAEDLYLKITQELRANRVEADV